jgi:hypothetical protein
MANPPIKQKYIESPEKLWQMWEEYKKEIDSAPDIEEVVTAKGDIVHKAIKKPYLRVGFEAYVFRAYGFHVKQYLENQDKLYDSYMGVVTHIRNEYENDQLSGTLTGRYKAPNLIARMHGLVEKTENQNTNIIKVIEPEEDSE